jgi:hypothetical protein
MVELGEIERQGELGLRQTLRAQGTNDRCRDIASLNAPCYLRHQPKQVATNDD